jgi:hypothetical protein
MVRMLRTLRVVLLAWEAVLVAVVLALLASGAAWAPLVVVYAFVNAGIVVLAVALERPRYTPGPGGGGEPLDEGEGRFAPTDEVFTDPTTGERTRVWTDAGTGERRYRPDPD